MKRWIMHVDMDAFYASVEQRDNPELRGKPVIIGGKSNRGVVATCSYEARAFGVRSAMSISKAKELCPQGIIIPPRMDVYHEVSDQIHKIMMNYADGYEPIAWDEAFLDISGMGTQYPTLGAIGKAIKKEIKEKTGLIASVGIAPNKFLAKMASDIKKPDGLCIIPYGKEKEILSPLPVRRLWGVGEVTEKKLIARGLRTIGDVQKAPLSLLKQILGNQGKFFKDLSFGIDNRPIETKREIKSIGDESTYEKDLISKEDILKEITLHSQVVSRRLRAHQKMAKTISLKIRFASFSTITRSLTVEESTNLEEEIDEAARLLLNKISLNEGVRLIGVTASNLGPEIFMSSLFSNKRDKQFKVEQVVDEIQKKFGEKALQKGISIENPRKEE